jgi:hypothetical protein
VDEDRGKYVVIATKKGPTDWVLLEAELIASGKEYEHIPPVYRAQWDQGIRSYGDSFEEARQRFEWMEYRLRRTWKVST